MPTISFYAVAKGRKPGIYTEWNECKVQILNYNGAKYKKFPNPSEAESWIQASVGADVARSAMESFLEMNPAFRDASKASVQKAPEVHRAPPAASAAVGGSSSAAAASGNPVTSVTTTAAAAPQPSAFRAPPDGEPWIVYCDGSCQGNGKVGAVAGVGVWWGKDDPRNICERCPGDQTNNRAELNAIIRVLETAPIDKRPLVIKTDSAYSINALEDWLPGWKRNGWRKSDGKPVLNVPLIKYADILLQERREFAKQPVRFVKVRGHSGEEGNDGADRLANIGATMPIVPDRDWEDLMKQARSNLSMLRPTLDAAVMGDNPRRNTPQLQAVAGGRIDHEPRQAQTQVNTPGAASNKPAVTSAMQGSRQSEQILSDQRVVVPRRSKPTSAVKQPVSVATAKSPPPPEDPTYGRHDIEISPEELERYAACLLSDDEFMNEAMEQGVFE